MPNPSTLADDDVFDVGLISYEQAFDRVEVGQPFFTGSQVYGRVTLKSDYDLVMLVDKTTASMLRTLYMSMNNSMLTDRSNEYKQSRSSLRYGDLNVILVDSIEDWRIWYTGTRKCIDLAKQQGSRITREQAKEVFALLRQKKKGKTCPPTMKRLSKRSKE